MESKTGHKGTYVHNRFTDIAKRLVVARREERREWDGQGAWD